VHNFSWYNSNIPKATIASHNTLYITFVSVLQEQR
jgi:hypothetical protein